MPEQSLNGNRLTYLLVGAGIGAALALLLTPKSGRDLRKSIAEASRNGVHKGSEAVHAIGEHVSERVESVRGAVDGKRSALVGAIEAGRAAYREERGRSDSPPGARGDS